MEYEELIMNAAQIKAEMEHLLSSKKLSPEQIQRLKSAIARMDEMSA